MFARLEQVLASAASMQKDKKAGQGGLFDDFAMAPPKKAAAQITVSCGRWMRRWLLKKNCSASDVSGHPLDSFRGHFDSTKITKLMALDEVDVSAKPQTVFIAGIVNTMEVRYSKKDNCPFATFTFEDFTGQIEMMAWSEEVP